MILSATMADKAKSAPGGRGAWRACEWLALGGQLSRSRLLEIKLADDRILSDGLADKIAESDAAAVADAGEVHRVIVAEEIALNVADGIQTLDDLVVCTTQAS